MEAQRFPRAARMLSARDFGALRGAGRRIATRHFHAEYRTTDHATARLGLAVSRRVSKSAVQRNRLKRLVRESFRRHLAQLPAVDILVIARSSAVAVESSALLDDLAALWRRLPALKPTQAPGTMSGGPAS
jgi:ribonuclease P protein component